EYCLAAHAASAGRAGLDEETLEAIRNGQAIESNQRLESLRIFVTRMVEQRGQLDQQEVRNFLEADFEERNIIDVALIVATKTLSNYVNHLAQTPLDSAFTDAPSHPPLSEGTRPHGVTH